MKALLVAAFFAVPPDIDPGTLRLCAEIQAENTARTAAGDVHIDTPDECVDVWIRFLNLRERLLREGGLAP